MAPVAAKSSKTRLPEEANANQLEQARLPRASPGHPERPGHREPGSPGKQKRLNQPSQPEKERYRDMHTYSANSILLVAIGGYY